MPEKYIYLDNAATTAAYPEAIESFVKNALYTYGNPSSLHKIGREAGEALESSREKISALLGCAPRELYFTGCGTESDNLAIKGAVNANLKRGNHIITTAFEHPAVMNAVKSLEKSGCEVTFIGVNENGVVDPGEFAAAVRSDTILAAVMQVNNEIGTIQPVREIAESVKEKNSRTIVFTDAVQSVGQLPVDAKRLGVDMLAFSGHKFGAPKGIGGLYVKSGTVFAPVLDGGGQERGKRGGTESCALASAMARALEISVAKFPDNGRVKILRDRLLDGIIAKVPEVILNGDRERRIHSNLNVSIKYIEGEALILRLDNAGICASTGSACSTASLDPSHVLLAIGLPHETAHGSLRLTLSHATTSEEVDYVLDKLPGIVAELRRMSPLWKN